MNLEQQIESLLFFKSEPVSIKDLCTLLKKEEYEIREALGILDFNLKNRGIVLVANSNEVELRTHPDNSSLVEELIKEDMDKELSRPSLETLSVVLYQGPITRKDIDHVRGVNSSFILRSLSARGLVEKNSKNEYFATMDLVSKLGLQKIEDLPEYTNIREKFGEELDEIVEKEENSQND